mgnify:CR=1 FL=1|jgi:hypothetical protein
MGKKGLLALIQSTAKPSKRETFGGKTTARVTDFFPQPDGSVFKRTRKINKDLSISDIIEHRHK